MAKPDAIVGHARVGLGQFLTYTPLPFIEDLRFGADPLALRKSLLRRGDPEPDPSASVDGLSRLSTIRTLSSAFRRSGVCRGAGTC